MPNILHYFSPRASVYSMAALFVATITVSASAYAYTLYTDRDAWLAAVAELSLIVEDFAAVPDGIYP